MGRALKLKPGDVSLGQTYEFWKAFGAAGGTTELAQMAIEEKDAMIRLVQAIAPSYAYDAVRILDFDPASKEVMPEPKSGEMIIRYGGWSLQELRDSKVGMQLHWYDDYSWITEKLPEGIYTLRIPVPDSNRKDFVDQKAMLPVDEEPAPVVLVATALLAHAASKGKDPLKGGMTRCRERTDSDYCVLLNWDDGQLEVGSGWDNLDNEDLWLSSLRTP